jgi:hypothetical protein
MVRSLVMWGVLIVKVSIVGTRAILEGFEDRPEAPFPAPAHWRAEFSHEMAQTIQPHEALNNKRATHKGGRMDYAPYDATTENSASRQINVFDTRFFPQLHAKLAGIFRPGVAQKKGPTKPKNRKG